MSHSHTPNPLAAGAVALALLSAFWPAGTAAQTEAAPLEVDLLAGTPKRVETIAGRVEVWNDRDDLHITYITEGGWCMTETRLHVSIEGPPENPSANIPQTAKGNPKPDEFAYGHDHEPCAFTSAVVIPLGDWEPGDKLLIAAHAELVHLDTAAAVGAWARGQSFPGKTWAMYFTFVVQNIPVCPPGGPFEVEGKEVGGACWWAEAGGSCDFACLTIGVYDEATRFFAGSDGTDENCRAVLDALGLGSGIVREEQSIGFNGLGCTFIGSERIRFSGNPTASFWVGGTRACACK